MKKYLFLTLIVLIALAASCTAAGTTGPTTSPTATTPTTAAGQTAGQLSAAGQGVFSASCAGCHGASGQGVSAPAVIGANASLRKYTSAQGLFNYIRTNMPGAAPGSLSEQAYLEVTAFLLLQNNLVTSGALFNTGILGSISLS
jgi:mono/diheme cytochrome c family protein